MGKYRILLASRVKTQLLNHTGFLAKVSIPAAKRFRNSFNDLLERLEENPFQFPVEEEKYLPDMEFRKALFEGRYKALFRIEGNTVWIYAVIDCRQQNTSETVLC